MVPGGTGQREQASLRLASARSGAIFCPSWDGWTYPRCASARANLSAAAPMASPPRAMRRRCAQGDGLRAAFAAPSPRKLHLGRGVRPSRPRCVPRLALRPQRAHPPSRRHAVAHGLAPVCEEPALCGGHLPAVDLERLTDGAAPHLDGHERDQR